ncbi:MAG: hypothetical protein H0W78_14315 [Planctomycetes bacterium]|nr:hypothetical protein [Planctomycetota bacterium]
MHTIAAGMLLLVCCTVCAAVDPAVLASGPLGVGGDEVLRATAFQQDGTLVVGGTIGATAPGGLTPLVVGSATAASEGAILRLSNDGRTVLSVTRVSAAVFDLAIDSADRIHVAAGAGGYLVLSSDGSTLVRSKPVGFVRRVDVGTDDRAVILRPSNTSDDSATGTGTVFLYNAAGDEVVNFAGYRNTLDVCLDSTSQTIVTIGWRQTSAFDGSSTQPVQIAYLRGSDYAGAAKWTGYDWSTDTASDRFLNKPTNNMADTRGYRVALGGDGKVYAAFECAGGNTIFRYSPFSITTTVTIVGGDKYHEWYNTAAEHKTFFARYEAATGAYLKGQRFVSRLSNGKGNAVRVKNGNIAANTLGEVFLTGASASGLPLSYEPLPAGSYTGGAFVLHMSSDFTTRRLCTRLSSGGSMEAAAIAPGRLALVGSCGATTLSVMPLQGSFGGGSSDGLAAVIALGDPSDTTPPATPTAPLVSGGTTARPTLSGVSEANAVIRIFDGGIQVATVFADGSGAWSWTPASDLTPGEHHFTVIAQDATGNASGASPAVTTTAPSSTGGGSSGSSSSAGGGGCGVGGGSAVWLMLLVAAFAWCVPKRNGLR